MASVNKSIPIRPTFVNIYKWPESEVEFVKTISSNNYSERIEVDSLICRQIYLRSYKFSRKKLSVTEKTMKCFSNMKENVVFASNRLIARLKPRPRPEGPKLASTGKLLSMASEFLRPKCLGTPKSRGECVSKQMLNNIKCNCKILGRAKNVTRAAVSIFYRLLSRSDKVHVARRNF